MSLPKTLTEAIQALVIDAPGIAHKEIREALLSNVDLADEFDLDPKKIATKLKNMTYNEQLVRGKEGYFPIQGNHTAPTPPKEPAAPSHALPPAPTPKPASKASSITEQLSAEKEGIAAEQNGVAEALERTVLQARAACYRYIDTLDDPYLEQLLSLMDSAKAAETNYRAMVGMVPQ